MIIEKGVYFKLLPRLYKTLTVLIACTDLSFDSWNKMKSIIILIILVFVPFNFTFGVSAKTTKANSKKVQKSSKPVQKSLKQETKCPIEMALVPMKDNKTNICVDKFEFTIFSKKNIDNFKPLAHQSQDSCLQLCKSKKKRLLTNQEWLRSCEGTNPQFCNIYREHPIVRKIKAKKSWIYKGVNCKLEANKWSKLCMNDPTINNMPKTLSANKGFSKCVSKFGLYNMVGNLGEWVSGSFVDKKTKERLARFNGGLYPQIKSSCSYSTEAHGPAYYDYSIGCRCAKDLAKK